MLPAEIETPLESADPRPVTVRLAVPLWAVAAKVNRMDLLPSCAMAYTSPLKVFVPVPVDRWRSWDLSNPGMAAARVHRCCKPAPRWRLRNPRQEDSMRSPATHRHRQRPQRSLPPRCPRVALSRPR